MAFIWDSMWMVVVSAPRIRAWNSGDPIGIVKDRVRFSLTCRHFYYSISSSFEPICR